MGKTRSMTASCDTSRMLNKQTMSKTRSTCSWASSFLYLEKLKNDEKLTLMDDGKKLPKVVSTINEDNDSEVEDVVNEHVVFIASTSLKSGNDSRYDISNRGQQNGVMIMNFMVMICMETFRLIVMILISQSVVGKKK
ncbi:hypothetical protein Tco_0854932 [Tanacetum coccineum]